MFPAGFRLTSTSDFAASFGLEPVQVLSLFDYQAHSDEVFFTGSLIEGFGNSLSDLDVLVITDGPGTHRMVPLLKQVRWIDIVSLDRKSVLSMVDSVPKIPAGFSDWSAARPAPFETVEILHDLCWGLRVSEPWTVDTIACALEGAKEKIARSWALSNIVSARARWHDACGALKDEQHMQADYVLSICLGHCIDAYTGILGETDINTKWRWCKLARIVREGRDSLDFERLLGTQGAPGSVQWCEAASVLADVIALFVTGSRSGLQAPSRDGDRYEILDGRWVVSRLEGVTTPMPAN